MSTDREGRDDIEAVAVLGEPTRRRLYELVIASPEPLARDDAAAQAGISRHLAAFHLDRLVQAGLLQAEFRRRGTRQGPGAGRPAKHYCRAATDIGVSLPPQAYRRLASLLAKALRRLETATPEVLADVAREAGRDVGREARARGGRRSGRATVRKGLLEALEVAGFEPVHSADERDVWLRNCPYRALAVEDRELTCGANLAWAEGVIEGLGDPLLRAQLSPATGRCCVVIRDADAAEPVS